MFGGASGYARMPDWPHRYHTPLRGDRLIRPALEQGRKGQWDLFTFLINELSTAEREGLGSNLGSL